MEANSITGQRQNVEDISITRQEYIRRILCAYCNTPGTTGIARRADRLLAAELYQQGVPLIAVENALTLAAARRLFRRADAPPLATIRSLAYFSSVIDEVLHLHVGQEYFLYLRYRLNRFTQA